MSLNFGENYDKKINIEDINFKTFEGVQIKLNESFGSDKISGRPTDTESKEILPTSEPKIDRVSNNQLNTLREPIIETLKRDLIQIYLKLRFVLVPKNATNIKELYNCKNIVN